MLVMPGLVAALASSADDLVGGEGSLIRRALYADTTRLSGSRL